MSREKHSLFFFYLNYFKTTHILYIEIKKRLIELVIDIYEKGSIYRFVMDHKVIGQCSYNDNLYEELIKITKRYKSGTEENIYFQIK